jgi:tRNA dimethylallyltransferase
LLSNKSVIVVCGPTAVGKTKLAIQLAKDFKTEIISADSRQCYKEMNIGVARPSEKELKEVKHHFIASHSIQDEVNASTFEQYALEKTNGLFKDRDVVIMAGGTGLYSKVFCEGIDHIPPVPAEIRNQIALKYESAGLQWLQNEVKQKDPAFFESGEIMNPQRLIRALEVSEATGQSIMSFRKGKKKKREFNIIKIGLQLPKEELHFNINTRVDKMIIDGLVDEVRSLMPYKHLSAIQTPGYKEIIEYLDKKISFDEAIELIKRNTRHFAKRQLTWFTKDQEINWFSPAAMEAIKESLRILDF